MSEKSTSPYGRAVLATAREWLRRVAAVALVGITAFFAVIMALFTAFSCATDARDPEFEAVAVAAACASMVTGWLASRCAP